MLYAISRTQVHLYVCSELNELTDTNILTYIYMYREHFDLKYSISALSTTGNDDLHQLRLIITDY